jgi:hypothetical protein
MYLFHLLMALLFPEVRKSKKGTIRKDVTCELCSKEYSYELSRKGSGRSTGFILSNAALMEARERAQANLAKILSNACDPVPCPYCGWYQEDMVLRARQLRYRWMNQVGLYLFPISVIIGMIGLVGLLAGSTPKEPDAPYPLFGIVVLTIAGLTALMVPGLPLLRYCLNRNYDLNSGPREDSY